MFFDKTIIHASNELNQNDNVSCEEAGIGGGKIFGGVNIKDGKVTKASCQGLKLLEETAGLEQGYELNDVCDCEMIATKKGRISCPDNKFLRTYYPLLKKGMCCSPCASQGKIKAVAPPEKCEEVSQPKNMEINVCPGQKLVRSVELGKNENKLQCCTPMMGGSAIDEHKEMRKECREMGIVNCNRENLNSMKRRCQDRGLGSNCKKEELEKQEQECGDLGLYYKNDSGDVVNRTSPIMCNNQSTNMMQKVCKQYGLKDCRADKLIEETLMRNQNLADRLEKLEKRQVIGWVGMGGLASGGLVSLCLFYIIFIVVRMGIRRLFKAVVKR